MSVERQREVARIFAGTGNRYDELVAEATCGEDARWKEALLARLDAPRRVLDLACGTGILTFLMRDRFPGCEVVGVDLTEDYLAVARRRAAERGDTRVTFIQGSADEIPLEGTFDTVTSCYVPKYVDLSRLVPLVAGALEPGGLVVMHDFLYPRNPSVRAVWEKRFREFAARARQNDPGAVALFEVVPEIIRRSRWHEELPDELRRHGFRDVKVEPLSWGTAAIVSGRRDG